MSGKRKRRRRVGSAMALLSAVLLLRLDLLWLPIAPDLAGKPGPTDKDRQGEM